MSEHEAMLLDAADYDADELALMESGEVLPDEFSLSDAHLVSPSMAVYTGGKVVTTFVADDDGGVA